MEFKVGKKAMIIKDTFSFKRGDIVEIDYVGAYVVSFLGDTAHHHKEVCLPFPSQITGELALKYLLDGFYLENSEANMLYALGKDGLVCMLKENKSFHPSQVCFNSIFNHIHFTPHDKIPAPYQKRKVDFAFVQGFNPLVNAIKNGYVLVQHYEDMGEAYICCKDKETGKLMYKYGSLNDFHEKEWEEESELFFKDEYLAFYSVDDAMAHLGVE